MTTSDNKVSPAVLSLVFFLLIFSLTFPARLSAAEKKTNKPSKPKVKASELWGIRRGPNFNKPKDAQKMTPEEALAEANRLQKKSDDKRKETEDAVKSMESGY